MATVAVRAEAIEFDGVEVIRSGLVLLCRVGARVVSVPPLRVLEGTTVSQPGDRGRLVLPPDVATDLGLAP